MDKCVSVIQSNFNLLVIKYTDAIEQSASSNELKQWRNVALSS